MTNNNQDNSKSVYTHSFGRNVPWCKGCNMQQRHKQDNPRHRKNPRDMQLWWGCKREIERKRERERGRERERERNMSWEQHLRRCTSKTNQVESSGGSQPSSMNNKRCRGVKTILLCIKRKKYSYMFCWWGLCWGILEVAQWWAKGLRLAVELPLSLDQKAHDVRSWLGTNLWCLVLWEQEEHAWRSWICQRATSVEPICMIVCKMQAQKRKRSSAPKLSPAPKLRGGYKQRLANASSQVEPSQLVQWLLKQFLWGHLAATQVQEIAQAAEADGLCHPDVQRTLFKNEACTHPNPSSPTLGH